MNSKLKKYLPVKAITPRHDGNALLKVIALISDIIAYFIGAIPAPYIYLFISLNKINDKYSKQ